MPTKKKDKKVIKKTPIKKRVIKQSQTQSQVVNVYTTSKRTVTKGVKKAPIRQSVTTGNTYYQPVSQAPNSFSLADVANLINKSQANISLEPFKIVGPIPNKIPIIENKVLYEGSFGPLPKRSATPQASPLDSQAEPFKRTPVNLKLPPLSYATDEQSSLEIPLVIPPLQKRSRRTKQQMDDARQMEREDIASYNLSSSVYNFVKPQEDDVSQISTTPLYEGGREAIEPIRREKRQYVKSGKYSKRKTE